MGQAADRGVAPADRAAVAARLTAQLLSGRPARDPVTVAERLLAIQSQDLRGAQLAIRARTRRQSVADVDAALTDDRSLVVSWLNRGTLHMVSSDDYWWLHALTAPTIANWSASRLRQEGVSSAAATRALRILERSLAADGPLTRARLRERLETKDIPVAGQALIHILLQASIRGLIVRGPMAGREQAYALVRDWLGPPKPAERATALGELARRFLVGHGPASDRDLAKWSGLGLRDVRAGLDAIAAELVIRSDGLVDLASRGRSARLPRPKLLGAFEPLLMGWASREPILGEHRSIVTSNGIFRPFALVGGRTVGTWSLERGAVALDLRDPISPADLAQLEADADDLRRFLRRA